MQQLSYTLENAEGKTYLREYVYYVGSFHYNWHKEIELICVLDRNKRNGSFIESEKGNGQCGAKSD